MQLFRNGCLSGTVRPGNDKTARLHFAPQSNFARSAMARRRCSSMQDCARFPSATIFFCAARSASINCLCATESDVVGIIAALLLVLIITHLHIPSAHLNGRLSAAVESDVVGYTTVALPLGYSLVGLPFDSLNGKTSLSIQDISIENSQVGDVIQYWENDLLQSATYRIRNGVSGWWKSFTELSTKTFSPGEGFWVRKNAEGNLTFSGKLVDLDKVTTITEAGKFVLISPKLPKEYAVNDILFEGISTGDQIQYWDGDKLVSLTYRSRGDITGWWSNFTTLSDKVFAPTEGFYLLTKTPVTVKFPDVR